jgi:hypothetical protein
MQRKYVEAGTALMAFYSQWTRFMLHRKVIPHRTRAIANEVKRRGKASLLEEFAKEVIKGALSRVDALQVGRDTAVVRSAKRTLRTGGGRKSDGIVLSPAARSYIFTARL